MVSDFSTPRTLRSDSPADSLATVAAERQFGRWAKSFTAHYEHEVNEHGVPVRRLVLVGSAEVDPSALHAAVSA